MLRSASNPLAAAAAAATASRSGRVEDPIVQRLQAGRTWAGAVASVWMLFAYPLAESGQEILLGKVLNVLIGCGITLVAGSIALSVFIGMARPPLRGGYARRLSGPGTALGTLLLSAAVCAGGTLLLVQLAQAKIIPWADIRAAGNLAWLTSFLLFCVGMLIAALALLLVAFFTLLAAVHSLNSCFRVGDVHELLPALISPFLVWSLFVLSLFDNPEVAAPPLVLYSFLLGGPLSVTALSAWEIRRLRTRYGVTMKAALGRDEAPQPPYTAPPAYAPYTATAAAPPAYAPYAPYTPTATAPPAYAPYTD
ncbi:hypothetical protein ALMP_42600 [Streptomyces sp. A012304]|nr:hypothetical protein ALMP_42600 [Streptomyces sp. A012304]